MKEVIRTHFNDLKNKIQDSNYTIKYNLSKRQNKLHFLKKNWTYIRYITKLGGVLTGSRALRCCSVNGTYLFNRPADDYDFLVTRSMLDKICVKFNKTYNLTDNVVKFYYDDIRIHLIVKDELPEYIERRGIRIATFMDVLVNKFYFIENGNLKETRKHQEDLTSIFLKFNSLQ